MLGTLRSSAALGVVLLFASTVAATLADGTIKDLSQRLQAPQVFFLSGLIMALLSLLASRAGQGLGAIATGCLKTRRPDLLALRAVATVVASWGFFYAVAQIPLAEVFLFVGLMPLISAVMSRLVLGEEVNPFAWVGLAVGVVGLLMLFPNGLSGFSAGHMAGLVGAFMGTVSLVVSRLMARHERNTLVQVLYPNLALALSAILVLPALWQPMQALDLALILAYSGLLFLARWGMVMVMQRLKAYVALPLMNIQFVWMVLVGAVFFGEVPTATTLLGAALVMFAGVLALMEQVRIDRLAALASAANKTNAAVPAE